jgi:hypothetical protein
MLFKEGSVREDQVADSLMRVEPVVVPHSVTLVVRNAEVSAMLSKEVNVTVVIAVVSLMRTILMLPTLAALAQAQLLATLSKKESALAVTLADLLTRCPLHIPPPNPVEFVMLTKMANVIVAPLADSAMRKVVPLHKSQVSAMPSKGVNVTVVIAVAMLMSLLILPDLHALVEVFAMLSKEVNVTAVRAADSVTKLPLLNTPTKMCVLSPGLRSDALERIVA